MFTRFREIHAHALSSWLRALADEIDRLAPGPPKFGVVFFKTKGGESSMSEITVKDDAANLTATFKLFDSEGNETTPDGTPTWSSSDDSVATPTASADGMSATIAVGAPGVCVIHVSAFETHDGEGDPTEIVAEGTVTVQPGDAVIGSVEFAT